MKDFLGSVTIFIYKFPNLGMGAMGFFLQQAMGYGRLESYGLWTKIPADQLGGPKIVWVMAEYGLPQLWFKAESTVAVLLK